MKLHDLDVARSNGIILTSWRSFREVWELGCVLAGRVGVHPPNVLKGYDILKVVPPPLPGFQSQMNRFRVGSPTKDIIILAWWRASNLGKMDSPNDIMKDSCLFCHDIQDTNSRGGRISDVWVVALFGWKSHCTFGAAICDSIQSMYLVASWKWMKTYPCIWMEFLYVHSPHALVLFCCVWVFRLNDICWISDSCCWFSKLLAVHALKKSVLLVPMKQKHPQQHTRNRALWHAMNNPQSAHLKCKDGYPTCCNFESCSLLFKINQLQKAICLFSTF